MIPEDRYEADTLGFRIVVEALQARVEELQKEDGAHHRYRVKAEDRIETLEQELANNTKQHVDELLQVVSGQGRIRDALIRSVARNQVRVKEQEQALSEARIERDNWMRISNCGHEKLVASQQQVKALQEALTKITHVFDPESDKPDIEALAIAEAVLTSTPVAEEPALTQIQAPAIAVTWEDNPHQPETQTACACTLRRNSACRNCWRKHTSECLTPGCGGSGILTTVEETDNG